MKPVFNDITGVRFPAWQLEVEAAVQEANREALFERIGSAEPAVLARMEALGSSPENCGERHALKMALEVLRALKEQRLRFFVPACLLPERSPGDLGNWTVN